jgi:nucleoid-associated protein YgaU
MALAQTYADALEKAKKVGIELTEVKEDSGKLIVRGKAQYAFDRDRFWDQIKTHPNWQNEILVMLDVVSSEPYGIWHVQSGDSLSKIAKEVYGNVKHYMPIFEANKDQLKDPDHVKVGQTLKLPPKTAVSV